MPDGLDGYFLAIILLTGIVVYGLVHNRDKIKLFFASTSQRRILVEQAKMAYQKNKTGMEDYERQILASILQDQLAHSREAVSDLEEGQEKLIERLTLLEGKLDNRSMSIEIRIERATNRLDNFLILLSRIEEQTRK